MDSEQRIHTCKRGGNCEGMFPESLFFAQLNFSKERGKVLGIGPVK
jgi:hypothetical protein